MRKLWFFAGATIGFVLGSRSGTGFYNSLQARRRSLTARPEVRDVLDEAASSAHDQAQHLAEVVNERVSDVAESAAQKVGNGSGATDARDSVDVRGHSETPHETVAASRG